jgi:hypothetical protein
LAAGCVVFFINGIVTGNALSVGLIFAGQRFGSSYLALCGGIVLIAGTAHNFIGGIIQASLFENYGVWKPIYWGLGCLMAAYFVIFVLCLLADNKKGDDGKRSISFRKQSSALSNVSQSELDLMEMSVLQQLKKNMGQTVKMYLNWLLALTMFCAGVVFMGVMSLWLVPYLMVKFDYTRSTAATITGLAFISSGVGSILIGIISKKVRRRKVFLFEGNALLFAFVALIYLDASVLSMPFVIILAIVTGIGFSHFSPFCFTICREYNWFYGNTETATAFVNMGLVLSGAVGQMIIGELLDIHWKGRSDHAMDGHLRVYTVEDYNFALIIVPICLGIMFFSEMALRETFSKNLEYETNEKKKMPKMQKVKTHDADVEDPEEGSNGSGNKDSYNSNPHSTEITSLNNESADDEEDTQLR